METNLNARPARSFIRRMLWPVGMAITVIGASTGGAYWCLNDTAEAQNPLRAHSAKDQLKELFGEERPTETKLNEQAKALFGETPTDKPKEKSQPTPAPAVPSDLGDRYGNYTPVMSPAKEETRTRFEGEVTRGQEPDANPLRVQTDKNVVQADAEVEVSEPKVVETAEIDTREVFGNTLPPAQEIALTPAPQPAVNSAEAMAKALENAQPLQSPAPQVVNTNPFAAAATSVSNDRYATAAPSPTVPPAAEFNSATSNLGAGQPSPAFPIEKAPTPTLAEPDRAEPELADPRPLDSGITPTPGLASQPGSGRPGERLLEGAQSPSLTILKLAPPEIQVGKRCTFGIRVQNTGQRTAQNVQIHDEIPLGTELVGTAPRASVSGGKIVWDLGTLSVGEERTVEMELIPTEEGELGSVATVMMAAQASAKARCTKPELALRLSSQPQVHAGQQHIVQVEVTNPGSGEATGVMVLETVPAGVSHEAGPALEFEIGTLAPGETRRLELLLTAEQAGRVKNIMTAKADAGLHVEASCEFEVIAPDLHVTVEGPERRFLERPATYQVSIDNPGTAPAKDVQLVTHLPKGLQFVSANNLGEYDAAQHSVYWSLAELPANERGTVELVALPVEAGQHTLQVTTKARDGLTDETQKAVTVEGIAALNFSVVDRDDPIEVGGETSYEIRVVNQGSKAATNVQVTAIVPPGLRAVAGHGDTRHAVQGDRVAFAPILQLGPKAETTFQVQVQGVRDGDHRLKVQITTDEIREPITKEESTRVYSDH
jgi:uncharacterized repeat protein (TIGR01451 family)